ncbi:MAG: RNA polymerase sigma factor [Odoribacter splanchnicus]
MESLTDQFIINLLQENLEKGGSKLFERYYKPLIIFAKSYTNNIESAEDLVQDVFYQFIKNKSYLTLKSNSLSTYLFRAVKNTCLNRLNQNHITISDIEQIKYDAIDEIAPSIELELIEQLMNAVNQLPERTRLVVNAIVLQNKRYKEVAQELDISVNTVKSLLSAALHRLREQFPKEYLQLLFLLFRNNNSF